MEQQERQSLGRIIAGLHWQVRVYFDNALAPFGLSSGTLPLLRSLLRRDGLNQQELSERLHVDKATITRMIGKRMESGYVRREKDPADKRAYQLFATQKAHAIAPEIKQVLRDWTAILSEGFTDEEKKQAFALLTRMRDNALRYREK